MPVFCEAKLKLRCCAAKRYLIEFLLLLSSPTCTFTGSQATPVNFPANGRPYTSGMRAMSQSVIKRQKISQGEAPNPVVFVATKDTRYALTTREVKLKVNSPKQLKILPKAVKNLGNQSPLSILASSSHQGFKETFDPVGDASGGKKTSPPGADQAAAAPPRHAPASLQHQRAHRPGGLKIRERRSWPTKTQGVSF